MVTIRIETEWSNLAGQQARHEHFALLHTVPSITLIENSASLTLCVYSTGELCVWTFASVFAWLSLVSAVVLRAFSAYVCWQIINVQRRKNRIHGGQNTSDTHTPRPCGDALQCTSWLAECLSAGNCQIADCHTPATRLTDDCRQVTVQSGHTHTCAGDSGGQLPSQKMACLDFILMCVTYYILKGGGGAAGSHGVMYRHHCQRYTD